MTNEIQNLLYGKKLLLDEMPFSIQELDRLCQNGLIEMAQGIVQSVIKRPWGKQTIHRCRRCGNTDQRLFHSYRCEKCHQDCTYCRKCLNMGVVKSCSKLVTWVGPPPKFLEYKMPICEWTGHLSPRQAQASEGLTKALMSYEDYLIWAVCGAGKTELLFPAIEKLLQDGRIMAIATPRTDVVRELYPRLKKAFPRVRMSAHYSGSQDTQDSSSLVLTTTHQLLRFYRYFDHIIIDEIDAFPFHHDAMLHYAVHQACRLKSSRAYLSATPPDDLKTPFLKNRLQGTRIPIRFHGHPLPVPKCIWIGNWKRGLKKSRLPSSFLKWLIKTSQLNCPIFIFVPSVTILKNLFHALKEQVDLSMDHVHAEDPNRHEKITCFRQGKTQALVTTTILERGVTVSRSRVAIFGSEDAIFDEAALVQMAGRAGRSLEDPKGEVVFFHYGKTLEMMKAINHIKSMNREGGF
ncbi:DEAD/DEAH box helicase [Terrilactibacillus laevilacticus]|uniref:DEAD/DEAH box helicase n=1 Tax=Terrilactibacillus laevilacticus TaxID=1380157 RepID=UPI001FE795E2|nr:helicase-related protein [Terrilactibacillus laevilacticus]